MKEEALAAGPKARGRPRKDKHQADDDEGTSTVTCTGDNPTPTLSPPIKAPPKRRRIKTSTAPADGVEPSAASEHASEKPAAVPVDAAVPKVKVSRSRRAKATPAFEGSPNEVEDAVEGKGVEVKDVEGKDAPGKYEAKKPGPAELKRIAKARLAFQKLGECLNARDYEDICLPGPDFAGLCWTALPTENLPHSAKIRVVLYAETFYAVSAVVPDYMANSVHAPCLSLLSCSFIDELKRSIYMCTCWCCRCYVKLLWVSVGLRLMAREGAL